MSLLVTGAGGTVGRYFAELRPSFELPLDLVDHRSFDVTDLAMVRGRLASGRYRAVVNLAAATDVDRCEKEPEWAFRLNAGGAWNLALACREHDVELVQVSTTQIFGGDGKLGPFSEMDAPHPVNVYARSKLAGEEYVRALWPKSYVLRTAWVMGGGKDDKKFVGKVADKLKRGEKVQAVDDQWGSPTYAYDLVVLIRELLKTRAYGLYHGTNRGKATRYDMVMEMKRVLGSDSPVEKVAADSFPLPAARPKSDAAVSYALASRGLGELMRSWQEALAAYLATFALGAAKR